MESRVLMAGSIAVVIAVTGAAGAPVFAQAGLSEVAGIVEDSDGNPIQDARVKLINLTNSALEFDAKTNRKGRYFIPNLLYNEPGEWNVTIEAEGYTPSKISVESRKSSRTLVGDPYDAKIVEGTPHMVLIKAFGKAVIDFVMLTESQQADVARKRLEEASARAAAAAAESGAAAESTAPDPLMLASNMVSDGNLEGSIEKFREAIEAQPEDAVRRELMAKVLYNLERFDEALASAETVRELEPDREELHLLFADIHAGRRAFDEASAELAAQAELTPDNIGVFRRMAWIAEQKGDNPGAIEAYVALVEHQPTNKEAWLALGSLYSAVGQPEKSGEAFTRVVELDPADAYKTFFNIGVLIENKSNPTPAEEQRALEAFRKAIEIKPDYAKAHRHLAYALLRDGDLAGARQELERYLEIEPNAADAGEVEGLVSSLPN
jgi:tetratricopeptide (TPR) repeat protein